MHHDQRVLTRSYRNLKANITLMNWVNLAGIAAQVAHVEFSRSRDVIEAKKETPLGRNLDCHFLFRPLPEWALGRATPNLLLDPSLRPNAEMNQSQILIAAMSDADSGLPT